MYPLDNLIAYFIGTGYNFYAGLALLIFAQLGFLSGNKTVNKFASRLALLALILVLFTTVVSYWQLGFILLAGGFPLLPNVKNERILPALLLALFIAVLGYNYLADFDHEFTVTEQEKIYLLGDSLSRGGPLPAKYAFPALLRRKYGYNIKVYARNGAKVSYYAARPELLNKLKNSTVIVELGGNDMLLPSPVSEYRKNLNRLLRRLAAGNNRIIMFELPLPLFKNSYGRVQHELSRKYDVRLIPRLLLARVISLEGLTVDGIHPTREGHRRLAANLAELFQNK